MVVPGRLSETELPRALVLRKRNYRWIGGRLVVASLLLGGTLLLSRGDRNGFASFTPRYLSALIAATFSVSLVFLLWVPRGGQGEVVARAQVAWDLLLTTGLIYVTDGIASGFTFLYGIATLIGAIVLGPRTAYTSAFAALFLYTLVGVSVNNAWIPHPPDQAPTRYILPAGAASLALLINLTGLLVVGVLAGNLSERLRAAGGELRKAATDVANLSRLNEDIVRSLTTGLITTDPAGVIQSVNPAAADMLRAGDAGLVGQKVGLFLPVTRDEGGAPTANESTLPREEGRATRPDGSAFPVGFTKTPLISEEGAVTGSVFVFRDLTEITQLRESAERAERLAALGKVAAGLAHEIRNPLSSISGAVQLVRESERLEQEDRQLLSIVQSEVERLDELVTTMLDIGKPRPPQRTPTDMRGLVESVVAVASKGLTKSRQIHIVLTLDDDAVQVDIDAGQIRQVIWNLLKNAIQMSKIASSVEVRVRSNETHVTVEIEDEGPGVAAVDRERVFDMFFSNRSHGIGLGLALVKQIVQAHAGSVSVEDGRVGALFRVVLPRATPAPRHA